MMDATAGIPQAGRFFLPVDLTVSPNITEFEMYGRERIENMEQMGDDWLKKHDDSIWTGKEAFKEFIGLFRRQIKMFNQNFSPVTQDNSALSKQVQVASDRFKSIASQCATLIPDWNKVLTRKEGLQAQVDATALQKSLDEISKTLKRLRKTTKTSLVPLVTTTLHRLSLHSSKEPEGQGLSEMQIRAVVERLNGVAQPEFLLKAVQNSLKNEAESKQELDMLSSLWMTLCEFSIEAVVMNDLLRNLSCVAMPVGNALATGTGLQDDMIKLLSIPFAPSTFGKYDPQHQPGASQIVYFSLAGGVLEQMERNLEFTKNTCVTAQTHTEVVQSLKPKVDEVCRRIQTASQEIAATIAESIARIPKNEEEQKFQGEFDALLRKLKTALDSTLQNVYDTWETLALNMWMTNGIADLLNKPYELCLEMKRLVLECHKEHEALLEQLVYAEGHSEEHKERFAQHREKLEELDVEFKALEQKYIALSQPLNEKCNDLGRLPQAVGQEQISLKARLQHNVILLSPLETRTASIDKHFNVRCDFLSKPAAQVSKVVAQIFQDLKSAHMAVQSEATEIKKVHDTVPSGVMVPNIKERYLQNAPGLMARVFSAMPGLPTLSWRT